MYHNVEVEKLIEDVGHCYTRPRQAPTVVDGLLKEIRDISPEKFGADAFRQRVNRMMALASLREIFSVRGLEDALADLDPDGEVDKALLQSGKHLPQVKPPFCHDRYIHKFLDDWYGERRYNIATYAALLLQLPAPTSPNSSSKPLWIQRALAWWFAKGVWTEFVLCVIMVAVGVFGGIWSPRFPVVFFGAIVVLAIVLGLLLACLVGAHVLKATVPRLAGCVMVGLVLPLSTQEVWKFSLTLGPITLICIAFILLVPSYLYLFIETNNALADVKKSSVRAGHILLRLCNLALFFSWMATTLILSLVPSLVSEHVGKSLFFNFIPRVGKASLASHDIYISLPTWLLFTVLSVFIGIYLQILWHDRPITSRL